MDRELLNCLYQYCFALLGNEADAYDLLHTSIEKYLKVAPSAVQNKQAYIRRIIKNQFIDNYRKQSKIAEEPYDDSVTYIDMDTKTLEQIMASQSEVERVWQYLDSSEREIVYLWAVEGYSMTELADYLEVPRGTLLSKVHRLRKRLEQHFGQHYMEGAG